MVTMLNCNCRHYVAVRGNRKDNQEWTIQIQRQHWAHTPRPLKQTQHTQETKKSNTDPKGKQLQFLYL
jgi:hypothetical protein